MRLENGDDDDENEQIFLFKKTFAKTILLLVLQIS